MKKAIAVEDKVIVEKLEKETTTASGLIIPSTAEKEPQTYGKVLSVGSEVNGIKEGDIVIAAKHGGQAFMLNDKTCICYMVKEIYAIIKEEND